MVRVRSPSVRMFIFRRQLRLRTDSSKSVTGISIELPLDRDVLLDGLVVEHVAAGPAVLEEEGGPGVVPVVGEDLPVAVLGLAEVHPVLVEDAQVDQGGQGDRAGA